MGTGNPLRQRWVGDVAPGTAGLETRFLRKNLVSDDRPPAPGHRGGDRISLFQTPIPGLTSTAGTVIIGTETPLVPEHEARNGRSIHC
jgi:hypothetical protein